MDRTQKMKTAEKKLGIIEFEATRITSLAQGVDEEQRRMFMESAKLIWMQAVALTRELESFEGTPRRLTM